MNSERRRAQHSGRKGRSSSRVRVEAEELDSGVTAENMLVLVKTNRLLVQALATLALAEDMPVEVYHEEPHDGSMVRVEVHLLKESVGAISCTMPSDELFMNADMCDESDNPIGEAAPYVATLLSRRNLIKFISQGKRRGRKKAPRKPRKPRSPSPKTEVYTLEYTEESVCEPEPEVDDEEAEEDYHAMMSMTPGRYSESRPEENSH